MPAQQDRNSLNSYSSPLGVQDVYAYMPERAVRAYSEGKYLAYQASGECPWWCRNLFGLETPWFPGCGSCAGGRAPTLVEPNPPPVTGTPSSGSCPGCKFGDIGCEIGKLFCEGGSWFMQPCPGIKMIPVLGQIPCIATIGIGIAAVFAIGFGLSRR